MRTPGKSCFTRQGSVLGGDCGLSDDFMTIGYCKDLDPNVIDIRLKPERREMIHAVWKEGASSARPVRHLRQGDDQGPYQILTPAENGFQVEINRILIASTSFPKTRNTIRDQAHTLHDI